MRSHERAHSRQRGAALLLRGPVLFCPVFAVLFAKLDPARSAVWLCALENFQSAQRLIRPKVSV